VVGGGGVGATAGTITIGIEVTIMRKEKVSTIFPSFNRTAILY
jgi:hypothetical protein